MALPIIGNMAPALSLPDENGNKVTLKDYRGKSNVVLYFYPRAMTPGCTLQACGIRDSQQQLAELNTVVFGVSPDPVNKLQKFIEKYELNFSLLADEGHRIADKYGVWGLKKFMGRESMGIHRTTFIIGKDGRLKHIMNKFKTRTHHQDLLACLTDKL